MNNPQTHAIRQPGLPQSARRELQKIVADPEAAFRRKGELAIFFDDLDHYMIECPNQEARDTITSGVAATNAQIGASIAPLEFADSFETDDGRLFLVLHWNRPQGITEKPENVAKIVLGIAEKIMGNKAGVVVEYFHRRLSDHLTE